MKQCCKNCRFSFPYGDVVLDDKGYLECRRRTPRPQDAESVWEWPDVALEDCCGEWEEIKAVKETPDTRPF
jgi:hypothetical protein